MSEAPADRPLTRKQAAFCVHYVALKHNGTKAYTAAGFTAATDNVAAVEAHRLLRNPKIKAEVDRLYNAMMEDSRLRAAAVLLELEKLVYVDMGDILFLTEQGEPYIDLSKATAAQMAGIAEVIIEDFTDNRERDDEGKVIARDVRRVKVKLYDKKGSIELAMKHLGLLKDHLVVEPTDELAALMLEARKRKP